MATTRCGGRRPARLRLFPFVRIGLVGVALALSACTTLPRETGELVFWEARPPSGDGVVHLLGTVHMARTATAFDPAISSALDASDTVALELDPQEMGDAEMGALVAELGMLWPETLPDVVAPETWEATQRTLQALGVPEANILPLQPWLAMTAIAVAKAEQEGFRGEAGVEEQLKQQAGDDRPVIGLETAREQFEALAGLPAESQERMLLELVEQPLPEPGAEPSEVEGGIGQLIDAWEKGDLDTLEILVAVRDEAVRDALYLRRNHRMTERIDELAAQGGRFFVAVGAAHMLGDEGIPALLAARGYRVVRIPKTVLP